MLAVAVTTAPRIEDYLPATLESLREAGFPEPMVFAMPGSRLPSRLEARCAIGRVYPWPNFLRAMRGLLDAHPDADRLAVFQDDVLVARRCREYLDRSWPAGEFGCLSLYTCGRMAKRLDGRGWLPLDFCQTKPHGALAMVFPKRSALRLLADPPGKGELTKTDTWIGRWCRETGLAWLTHVPSLVQHVGRRSAIKYVPGEQRLRSERRWTDARYAEPWVRECRTLLARLATPGPTK